ncbi:hypothetical protein AAHC03_022707 [Spirometra sp. Aus1]
MAHSCAAKFGLCIPVCTFGKTNGSSSNPCKLPNSCWQLLNDRQYAILESGAVSGTGSILVNPVDGSKSGSKLIVRDTNGTAMGPKLQNNAGSVEVLEMDPNMNTVAYILYSENVKSTTVNGNIVFTNEAGGHSKKRLIHVRTGLQTRRGAFTVMPVASSDVPSTEAVVQCKRKRLAPSTSYPCGWSL